MLCREAKVLLADLRLGDLPDDERARVEEHVASCAACRGRLQEVGESLEALRRAADSDRGKTVPPADLSRVLPRGARRPRIAPIPRRVGRAAAILLAALGLAALFETRVTRAPGSLTLSLRFPWTDRATPPVDAAPVDLLVRREVQAALAPAFRDLASFLVAAEETRGKDLAAIARWIEERRIEDARELVGVLASTREDLRLTQDAVLEVAGRLPDRRPGW